MLYALLFSVACHMERTVQIAIHQMESAGKVQAQSAYKGRTVQGWKYQLRHKSDRRIDEAKRELVEGKGDALPVLIELLKDDDMYFRSCAIECLAKMGKDASPAKPSLVRALNDLYDLNAVRAAEALAAIGCEARDAIGPITELERRIKPDDLRERVTRARHSLEKEK